VLSWGGADTLDWTFGGVNPVNWIIFQRPNSGVEWAAWDTAGGPDRTYEGATDPGYYMIQGQDADGHPVVQDSNIVHHA